MKAQERSVTRRTIELELTDVEARDVLDAINREGGTSREYLLGSIVDFIKALKHFTKGPA